MLLSDINVYIYLFIIHMNVLNNNKTYYGFPHNYTILGKNNFFAHKTIHVFTV